MLLRGKKQRDLTDIPCFRVAIWDLSDELTDAVDNNRDMGSDSSTPVTKFTEPLSYYQAHMSGVNALEVVDFDDEHLLVVTGGEDNAVTATLVKKVNGKTSGKGLCVIPNAHASSVTGVYIDLGSDRRKPLVATISTDQRFNLWAASVESDQGAHIQDGENVSLSLIDSVYVDIPDPSALDGIRLK